jgi:hypothetical protein
MGRLSSFNNFPPADFEPFSMLGHGVSNRVVEQQARPQRYERAIGINVAWVSREIDGVDPMPRKMPLQPVDAGQIGSKSMLNIGVLSHMRQLGCIRECISRKSGPAGVLPCAVSGNTNPGMTETQISFSKIRMS